MARRLLNLRDVPLEEVEALRTALADEGLEFYETPPSAFGISAGGIWIRHDADWPRAQATFREFQARYAEAARAAPRVPTFREQWRQHPIRIVGFTAAALLILALMAWPVLELWRAR